MITTFSAADRCFGMKSLDRRLCRVHDSPRHCHFGLAVWGAVTSALAWATAVLSLRRRLGCRRGVTQEHAMGNYHYGVFLADIGRPKESLPYLNKARDKGVMPALYSIGMAQLTLGDMSSAPVAFAEYQKRNPSDWQIAKSVDAIRSGTMATQNQQGG